MSYTLVLPCAGRSRRYPNMRPKYLLTTPDGDAALRKALLSVPQEQISRIVIGISKDHDERYGVQEALRRAIPEAFEIVVVDYETNGPAETVQVILERAGIDGPICIKDADSFFEPSPLPDDASFLSLVDLREHQDMTRVAAKSFALINEQNLITSVVEKNVVSNFVSCGLYGFASAQAFRQAYDEVIARAGDGEIFVSHVLTQCIRTGEAVHPNMVTGMIDVGTASEWARYVHDQAILFVDLDGVVFRNQSRMFPPYWDDPEEPLDDNVAVLLEKQRRGAQLVFATSRPESYRAKTQGALKDLGFEIHALVMDCHHSKRYLVNDFSPSSHRYPTAIAVNLRRNQNQLRELFDDE